MNRIYCCKQIHCYFQMVGVLFCILLMASCSVFKPRVDEVVLTDKVLENEPQLLFVGTYTDKGSKGIYSFKMESKSKTLEQTAFTEMSNPSYFTFDDKNDIFYIVNENQKQPSVSSAKLNRLTGELDVISSSPTLGKSPCYITLKNGKLVSANYNAGSITLFLPSKDGKIGVPTWRFELGNKGDSHPHCAVFSPDGKQLYVVDLGLDRIFQFAVNEKTPPLTTLPDSYVSTKTGSGPRHLVFDKKGRYAYLLCENSGELIVYKHADGDLELIQNIYIPEAKNGASAHIALSPDGKFLYTSHRQNNDGIATFKVDRKSGQLQQISYLKTPRGPRHFGFSHNGRFCAVACTDAGVVQIYRRDTESGMMTPTSKIKLSEPAFVTWLLAE